MSLVLRIQLIRLDLDSAQRDLCYLLVREDKDDDEESCSLEREDAVHDVRLVWQDEREDPKRLPYVQSMYLFVDEESVRGIEIQRYRERMRVGKKETVYVHSKFTLI